MAERSLTRKIALSLAWSLAFVLLAALTFGVLQALPGRHSANGTQPAPPASITATPSGSPTGTPTSGGGTPPPITTPSPTTVPDTLAPVAAAPSGQSGVLLLVAVMSAFGTLVAGVGAVISGMAALSTARSARQSSASAPAPRPNPKRKRR
jgi:hypothetical protein